MSNLILDSLEITHFRTFRHLKIKRLARVNLIVGKNNVGKTSLLEALQLYASRGEPHLIWDILETHRESPPPPHKGVLSPIEQRLQSLSYLFYGRPEMSAYPGEVLPEAIEIGLHGRETLSLALAWYKEIYDFNLKAFLIEPLPEEQIDLIPDPIPVLVAQWNDGSPVAYRLDQEKPRPKKPVAQLRHHILVPTQLLSEAEVDTLWNNIALTYLEDEVLKALQLITPEIERFTLLKNLNGNQSQRPRLPMIKLAGEKEPIPITSLGEGINRLFHIALALVNAQNGLLLIDEIESGLYYDIQPDVWHMIFELAPRLNMQVIATTHSWEAIDAFQIAANENKHVEGLLFSLRPKKGKLGEVAAITYQEEELEIAAHAQIEVR